MAEIISFMGAPGVGKSYIAKRLSKKLAICFYDREIILDAIFNNDRESEYYKELAGPITKSIWEIAIANAVRGVSIILESPMERVTQGKSGSFIDSALEKANIHHFDVKLIYCVAQKEIVFSYLKKRGSPRDTSKYENWDEFVKKFIDVSGPSYEHLKIDTTNPVEKNLELIMDYL